MGKKQSNLAKILTETEAEIVEKRPGKYILGTTSLKGSTSNPNYNSKGVRYQDKRVKK